MARSMLNITTATELNSPGSMENISNKEMLFVSYMKVRRNMANELSKTLFKAKKKRFFTK